MPPIRYAVRDDWLWMSDTTNRISPKVKRLGAGSCVKIDIELISPFNAVQQLVVLAVFVLLGHWLQLFFSW